METNKLLELIADDDLGLLAVKPKQAGGLSEDERLAESFYEIADFVRAHGREPTEDPSNMQEARLAMRLANLRQDSEKAAALADLDEFELLTLPPAPESLDDILADDSLNLLGAGQDANDIFTLRHVTREVDTPDYVAQRKPCADFATYKAIFKACHADLKQGRRCLMPFVNEQQIRAGQFFILRGVMAYVAAVGNKEKKKTKVNARLRCIFENGTESDLLLRSLARNLYKDGRRISEPEDRLLDELQPAIGEEDTQTGIIYVLKSLSANPAVAGIEDLYKIGFSTTPVEERIKDAADDPTFLMGEVRVAATFHCYNLNPQKLELLLHKFFAKACLEVDVYDKAGRRHAPREWFVAPLPVIEEAIRLIVSGEVLDHVYDHESTLIRARATSSCLFSVRK
jgi:hypothetical protein